MKIASLYNRHDGGFAILEDGKITMHTEFERYNRIKESGGDSLALLRKIYPSALYSFNAFVSVMPKNGLETASGVQYDTHVHLPKNRIAFYGHHLCHAAHAYFSSPYDSCIAISVDNAGMDEENRPVSLAIYLCQGNEMQKVYDILAPQFSLGDLWGRMTRFVFKLWSGYPRGHQAGSVMAMAALGDPSKYYNDLLDMCGKYHSQACQAPVGMKRGVYVPPEEEVVHPYLNKYRLIAEESEQEKYNLAASLQKVTEEFLGDMVAKGMEIAKKNNFNTKNIVFSGGCSLNSVAMGKIASKLSEVDWNCYVPPVPYDGGLNIGAAQYHYHSVLGYPKHYNQNNWISPYLGERHLDHNKTKYNDIKKRYDEKCLFEPADLDLVADLLKEGQIVSVYQGCSESGRRALGNRSILANPAFNGMKSMINDKVKHRQWYRPFAPSVLHEYGEEWFENYFFSPYMGFVFRIKSDMLGKAPAIEHFDGTARIQSVSKDINPYYYDLISKFKDKTGIPMLLNTSFNDREPIVETIEDAFNCFMGTDIDYLYVHEWGEVISKK